MDEARIKPNPNSHNDFTVMIEAQALIDYMKFLRGITKDGNFYPNKTSLELSRFPAFDGSDWDLPESFADFFDAAVKRRKLFERARPYDFALREIMFLTQNDAEVIIYVGPELIDHHSRINDWCANYLPGIRTVAGEIEDINTKASAWVARSPELAHWLKKAQQPFVLIDGKENRQMRNVIRSIRWDQAGFFLRQAQFIHGLRTQHPQRIVEAKIPESQDSHAHLDINQGYKIFPPNVSEASIWVGEEISVSIMLSNGSLTHDDGSQMSEEQVLRSSMAIESDLEDLQHKKNVLNHFLHDGFKIRIDNPHWSRLIMRAEVEMQDQLRDIERVTRTNPVTGELPKKLGKTNTATQEQSGPSAFDKKPDTTSGSYNSDVRMLMSIQDLNLPRRAEVIEIIESISDLAVNGAQLRGKSVSKSNITGALVEDIAASFLHNKGWRILMPRHRTKSPTSPKRNGDISIEWIGPDGKLERGAVDLIALDPNRTLHIVEVKARKSSELSPQQKKLKKHLENSGRILNPDCAGLRPDQKSFSANYTVVACEQKRFTKRRKEARKKQNGKSQHSRKHDRSQSKSKAKSQQSRNH